MKAITRLLPGMALAGLLASAACLLAPATASAATAFRVGGIRLAGATTQTSTNWAGYAVTHQKPFSTVTGSWVEPAATCGAAAQTYSAFWIGLGGFSASSFGVEQVGTLVNCSFGIPTYSAWYELFPAPPVSLKLRVRPGDALTATVTVVKRKVYIRLKNVTTGTPFVRALKVERPDLGSAEWIAEAPTGCDAFGSCTTLPLTDFGTVDFTHGSAAVQGHRGRISDPTWATTTSIELHGDLNDPNHPSQANANAIPGALGPDGGSFSVSWQQLPLTPPPPAS
jgi:Peptidase A4 family